MSATRTDASTGQLVEAHDATKDPKKDDKKQPSAPPEMRIKVYSPFKTYYDADAFSISAINATGPFDILPHHHNFLTLLSPGEIMIRGHKDEQQRIRISGGLMHVKADKVTVFLDI